MTVTGKDETFERTRPSHLEGARHRRGGLASANHDSAPSDRVWDPIGERLIGVSRCESSIEQGPQKLPGRLIFAHRHVTLPSCQARRHFISSTPATPALDPLRGKHGVVGVKEQVS